jgi:hypothetical protein
VGCARRALTATRGELDCGAVVVTVAGRLSADDTGCGAIRTAGAWVTRCDDGVV